MAYTAVYGAYSSSWTPSGASLSRKIRARMYYQVTETPTTYKIDFYGQGTVYNDNLTTTLSGQLFDGGTQKGSTGSHKYTYNSNGTNYTEVYYTLVSTQSITINKTASPQTRTIKCYVYRGENPSFNSTASITLTIPAKITYNITYNANGGTDAPANETKTHDVNYSISSTQPTRTGYTFNGWNTASDGSGMSYSAGQNYTDNAALTLYAQWAANTYTVVYDANGGSGTMSSDVFTYDSSGTLKTNTFTRTDYLFAGWAESQSGAVKYIDSQSVMNIAASGILNLYAVWKNKYEAPDIQTVAAFRWDTTYNKSDDSSSAGRIEVYVIPAYKYTTITTKEYTETQVEVQYKISNDSSYDRLGVIQTVTVNQDNSIDPLIWTSAENVFDTAEQYDILITARAIEREGEVAVVKITSTPKSTFIPVAEFILDFDPDGESIGLFTLATGSTADKEKALRIEGDIVFLLNNAVGNGTDYEILTAITNLGWSVNAD